MRLTSAIATFACFATTAAADLNLISFERYQSFVVSADGQPVANVNISEPNSGLWRTSLEEFALPGGNAIGGATFQRSDINPDLSPGQTLFLQGSASLFATINNETPLAATAESVALVSFRVSETTAVRLVYDFETRGTHQPINTLGGGPASAIFATESGSRLFSDGANLEEITTGQLDLNLSPGDYTILVKASVTFSQGGDFDFGPLPPSPDLTAGYTFSMIVLPAPSAALPLAGVLVLARRRRAV